jgi:[NiFe] hydrogenase large subunit
MAKRIVVDPITRIEGHLRIEVEVAGGKVKNAWSSGTLFRGIENILKGRDPRDAWLFTQRSCGVCTYVHGQASIQAVESAYRAKIPNNARLVRNLMMAAQFIHDHPIHFYHLSALDWVDVVSALKADAKKAADLSNSLNPKRQATAAGLQKVKDRLASFVKSGQLGPFANGYWGHPAMKLPPEVNLIAVNSYLLALQKQIVAAKAMAVFGGKNPHLQSLVAGGVSCIRDLNAARIGQFRKLMDEMREFIDVFYIPDILAVASFYKDWAGWGGCTNYLAYGEFPDARGKLFLPRGAVFKRNVGKVAMVDQRRIMEDATRSWYKSKGPFHPYKGRTDARPTAGAKPNTRREYSWLKAPRYRGQPMEVGPLARVLVAYGKGDKTIKGLVDYALKKLGVPVSACFSTLGRHAARALETKAISDAAGAWCDELLANVKKGDLKVAASYKVPKSSRGYGFTDVPRGALGHWVEQKGGKIKNYQYVVPSTWNLGPRDKRGKLGPVEEALLNTPVADPKRPLEIIRTVHSFDPCIACAVHVIDPESNEVRKFRVT